MSARAHGSSGHIAQWLRHSAFRAEFSKQLRDTCLRTDDVVVPTGEDARERELPTFCERYVPTVDATELRPPKWWKPHTGRTPTWDMLATCAVAGQNGVLLVEAKAHRNERELKGKPLGTDASAKSKLNHAAIGVSIERAQAELNFVAPGFRISRDRYYQLSNRVAWAWRLAHLGVPVTLAYLGFVGDEHFTDGFTNAATAASELTAYLLRAVPPEIINSRVVLASGGSLQVQVAVLNAQPPRAASATC